MKRVVSSSSFYGFVLCSALMAGCTESVPETEGTDGKVLMTFTAAASSTRTAITPENQVYWSVGDRIALFSGDSPVLQEFVTDIAEEALEADFHGYAGPADYYTAFYPYADRLDGNPVYDGASGISFTLPEVQTAVAGGFDSCLNPSFAKVSGGSTVLAFKNICGLVKMSFSGADLERARKVTISDNGGHPLSGSLSLNISDASVSAVEGVSSVSLVSDAFVSGSEYYFVVAPVSGALSSGLTLTVYDEAGEEIMRKTASKAVNVQAGRIANLGDVPVVSAPEKDYEVAEDGTYLVYTAKGLKAWADYVRSDQIVDGKSTWLTNVTLMNDITLTEKWTPVGNISNEYYGTFDGNGKSISGLKIVDKSSQRQALIGQLDGIGVVKNLTVIDPVVSGHSYCAAIVGYNGDGKIENCHVVNADIQVAEFSAGTIAGYNNDASQIIACHASGKVAGKNYIGGIVGECNPTNMKIIACSFEGNVSAVTKYAGGIIGRNYSGDIIGCYAKGTVTGESECGGIAGNSSNGVYDPGISASFFIGSVSAGSKAGLAVGYLQSGKLKAIYYVQDGGEVSAAVGSGSSNGTSAVSGGDWSAAIEDMNTYLAEYGYSYVMDTEKGHPVIQGAPAM